MTEVNNKERVPANVGGVFLMSFLNHLFRKTGKTPRRIRRNRILSPASIGVLGFMVAYLLAPPPKAPESQEQKHVVAEDDIVEIPAPSRMLAKGELIEAGELRTLKWPRRKLGNAYLRSLAEAKGLYALTPLPAYLPIPLSALSSAAPDANAVADAIPSGMRAVTVKVDAESAVEGWARPGNAVDVILVRPTRDNALALESLVIAENIKILSAGATTISSRGDERSADAPNTVTLLVSQEDALRIKTGAKIGRLTFALRGSGDSSPTLATTIDGRRIFGGPKPETKAVSIVGRAKGPDGKTYVLADDSKWLRSGEAAKEENGSH